MKMFKIVLKLSLFLLIIAAVVFAIIHSSNNVCDKISVSFRYSGDSLPIDQAYVENLLTKEGVSILGLKAKDIDQERISSVLSDSYFIKDVYANRITGSTLQLSLHVARPIISITEGERIRLFIDEEGALLPYDPRFEAAHFKARGSIPIYSHLDTTELSQKVQAELFRISEIVFSDSIYYSDFKTITRNKKSEYALISSRHSTQLLIGSVSNFNDKLTSLAYFYHDIFPRYINSISTIDLRFKKRIIVKNKRV